MVSTPTYDPNVLASHDLRQGAGQPTSGCSRTTTTRWSTGRSQALYPPGSTFKLVTAAAALSSGSYTEDSVLPGPAVLDLPQTTADAAQRLHRQRAGRATRST